MMMRVPWTRVTELTAIGLLLAGSAWLGQLVHHNYVVHSDAVVGANALAPGDLPAHDPAGTPASVQLAGRERPLLLLVLSTECGFCEANMPNWRSLADRIGEAGERAPEVLVLTVSTATETRAYLKRHGLDLQFRVIAPSSLPLLGIEGYPGTVAFHPSDPSLKVWAGVLDDGQQEAVMSWSRTPLQSAPADAN